MNRFNDPFKNIRKLVETQSTLFSRLSMPILNNDLFSRIKQPSITDQIANLYKTSNFSELNSCYEMINKRNHFLPETQMLNAINKMKITSPDISLTLLEEMSRKNSVNELVHSLSSNIKPLQDLVNTQKNILNNQNSLLSFSESLSQIDNLRKTTNLAFESIDKGIFSSFNRLSTIGINYSNLWKSSSIITESIIKNYDVFNETKLSNYFKYISEIINAEENDDIDQIFNDFQESFIDDSNQGTKSLIRFEGRLGLLLNIFIFLYSLRSQYITDKKLDQIIEQNDTDSHRIERMIEMQENFINKQLPDEDVEKEYHVINDIVNLRLKPDVESEQIGILYPNQRVIVDKESGDWLHVVYFNYLENITNTGWVYGKYIEEIEDEI